MIRVHGTAIALGGDGVLLRGPSGAGKSDFALRLIDQGARLVADDQTELRRDGDDIIMSAPATIAGQIEVRGLGIISMAHVVAPLRLVVDLMPSAEIERMPEHRAVGFLDRAVPVVALAPFEASAPAKLRLALRSLAQDVFSPVKAAVPS
ncbi:MAG TPA: HPr kinase/phosphatase C-terminal domain-containing protein [Stellaceae bacterium]|jgi:serine kinase of HPr protein (carbohydrate metabolism regulator)|nr:HPr kinase/phosphatase C-terminal domain-containing protein [Stellaceae bacterium]